MAYNHALRARATDATGAEYEPNDGNLAATSGSLFVAMWLRSSRGINTNTFVHLAGNNSFFLYGYRSGLNDFVFVGPNGAGCTWTNGNNVLKDGGWHWVTLEVDYSAGAGNGVLRVSSDGVVVASQTGRTWTAPTTFSKFVVGGSNTAHGLAELNIDDVAIFDGSMSDAERTAAYNSGNGIKGLGDTNFANATRKFYASYDQNSLTADSASGTAAAIGSSKSSFIDGFRWGGTTGFETTTLGPDEMYHGTNGELLYDPDRGGSNGYDHWSARYGAYSEPADGGRFRVTVDAAGDLETWCQILAGVTIPHYFSIRFQTNGLFAGEALTLKFTCPDSRGDGAARAWSCTIESGQIIGKTASDVVTVDTEAWVNLRVQCWVEQDDTYAVYAHAIVNDEHELQLSAGDVDSSYEMLGQPSLRFTGSGLTGTPYLEIASLAIHSQMQPALKKSSADTFPDELHLVATTNAGREAYDPTSAHPFTDVGLIMAAAVGTWANNTLGMPSAILDVVNNKLLIWTGATHNEPNWYTESGIYKYNIGFADLDLTAWPAITIADGVGVTQGAVVYRPNTPFLYPHHPGVIDCDDGRRMMVCVRYHLPDSPNNAGQCRGDVVVGELTANETFVPSNGGKPVVTPRAAPSYADTQFNTNTPAYNPDAEPSMKYMVWGQAFGDRNTWSGGSSLALRGCFLLLGETMETLAPWPTGGSAILPIWNPPHTFHMLCRATDDFSGVSVAGGASRSFYLLRGRAPMLLHPPQRYQTFHDASTVQSAMLVDDAARGVFHVMMDNAGLWYAHMRRDGFDWIGIDSGQTTGDVTTVTIQKPSSGWSSLYINVDADETGGKIEVAVIDPATGDEIAGYAQADCSDITADSTDAEVTWGSNRLSSLTDETLRLKFHLTRADSGDPTPRLYSYRVADWPSAGATQATKMVRSQDLLL